MSKHVVGKLTTIVAVFSLTIGVTTSMVIADSTHELWTALIDDQIEARLKAAKVSPTGLALDGAYLRRVTLDLVGRPPTLAELEAYEADRSDDKRLRAVEVLILDPGFARYQASELDQLLMGDVNESLQDYLEEAMRLNKSWETIFREIVLAKDSKEGNPPAAYFRSRIGDLDKLTNSVSVAFIGVNVSCAQCHDHPLVFEWTQAHFFGMKSFFGRMYQNGKRFGERDYGLVTYKNPEGNSFSARPMFLTGTEAVQPPWWEPTKTEKKRERELLEARKKADLPPPEPVFSLREQFVRLVLLPDERHYFSQAIVNHMWRRYLGTGIVSPVDQMHPANTASHPELLAQLAESFAEHGYDLQALIKALVLSDTYARSSLWVNTAEAKPPAVEYFAVAQVRPLTPFQYGAALMLSSTGPEKFRDKDGYPADAVARSGDFVAKKLEYPGDDFQIGVREALFFSNSEEVQNRILRTSNDSLVGHLVRQSAEDPTIAIQTAFRNTLCRLPVEKEVELTHAYLSSRQDQLESAWKQIVWALLTSSEFRFNH